MSKGVGSEVSPDPAFTPLAERPVPGEEAFATSANITGDPSGIAFYTEDVFVKTIRTGRVAGVRALGPAMPWVFFKTMTDDDLKAIFAFLTSVPPVRHRVNNSEPPSFCALCGRRHGLGELNVAVAPIDHAHPRRSSRGRASRLECPGVRQPGRRGSGSGDRIVYRRAGPARFSLCGRGPVHRGQGHGKRDPASIFLELRQGTCAAPGAVAAVSPTGRLAQNVRAGVYQISLTNTSDIPVSYSLTVQYTRPSN